MGESNLGYLVAVVLSVVVSIVVASVVPKPWASWAFGSSWLVLILFFAFQGLRSKTQDNNLCENFDSVDIEYVAVAQTPAKDSTLSNKRGMNAKRFQILGLFLIIIPGALYGFAFYRLEAAKQGMIQHQQRQHKQRLRDLERFRRSDRSVNSNLSGISDTEAQRLQFARSMLDDVTPPCGVTFILGLLVFIVATLKAPRVSRDTRARLLPEDISKPT